MALPRFAEAFIEFLERDPIISINARQRNMRRAPMMIHMEKLDNLAYELVDMGLAEEAPEYSWYRVERNTAKHFMSYLAITLGAVTEYRPATDDIRNLATLVGPQHMRARTLDRRQNWRARILDNLLPTPMFLTNMYDLVEFKGKYATELIRFRNHIEVFLLDLAAAPQEQAEERINRFLSGAREQSTELAARMREHKWRFLSFSALCALTGSLLPFIAAAQQGSGLETVGEGFNVLSAALSLFSAQQLHEIQQHPLAYSLSFKSRFELPRDSKDPSLREMYL
jgi:hypothetical protein